MASLKITWVLFNASPIFIATCVKKLEGFVIFPTLKCHFKIKNMEKNYKVVVNVNRL